MKSKIVLITGASSGFGKATAQLLLDEGHKLILVARRIDLLQEFVSKYPKQVYISCVDVRNRSEVKQFFQSIPQEFINIDVVVNNAGLAKGLDTVDIASIDDWEDMIDTNIKGMLYVTKSALDIMKATNHGLIINIGSVAATVPYKGGNVYGATKAFVKQFSRNMRADLFGTNIKVTNIEPGMAETEFSIVRFNGNIDKAKGVYMDTRALKAEDIANTIKWVIEQPDNVNIDNIEIMPVDQTFGGMIINRKQ